MIGGLGYGCARRETGNALKPDAAIVACYTAASSHRAHSRRHGSASRLHDGARVRPRGARWGAVLCRPARRRGALSDAEQPDGRTTAVGESARWPGDRARNPRRDRGADRRSSMADCGPRHLSDLGRPSDRNRRARRHRPTCCLARFRRPPRGRRRRARETGLASTPARAQVGSRHPGRLDPVLRGQQRHLADTRRLVAVVRQSPAREDRLRVPPDVPGTGAPHAGEGPRVPPVSTLRSFTSAPSRSR